MSGCTQYMPSYTLQNCFIPLHQCLVRSTMPKRGDSAGGKKSSGKGAMAIATKMGAKARDLSEKVKGAKNRREAELSSEGSELGDENSSGDSGVDEESEEPLSQALPESHAKRRKKHSADLVEVIALSNQCRFHFVFIRMY